MIDFSKVKEVQLNGKQVTKIEQSDKVLWDKYPFGYIKFEMKNNAALEYRFNHNRYQSKKPVYFTEKCNDFFISYESRLEKISVYLPKNNITDLTLFLYRCDNITNINLSHLSTSNVTNMHEFLNYCANLKEVDLSSFDTRKVKDMRTLLAYCINLKKVDVSSFDTRNAEDLYEFLRDSPNVETLKLGENFFRTKYAELDLQHLSKWTDDSVRLSLVTNLFDRKTNELQDLTLKLSNETKAVLSNEDKEYIKSKGYIIQ